MSTTTTEETMIGVYRLTKEQRQTILTALQTAQEHFEANRESFDDYSEEDVQEVERKAEDARRALGWPGVDSGRLTKDQVNTGDPKFDAAVKRGIDAAERDRVERYAPQLLAMLREAVGLMPLDGTKKRADWVTRAHTLVADAEGR